MLGVLLFGVAAAADPACAQPSSRQDVGGALGRASAAYEAADLGAFEAAVEDARRAVPCLGVPITPSVAAEFHRIEGLSAFVASDADRAGRAFGAARRLDPDFVFPDAWAPVGNPVRAAYEAGDASTRTVAAPFPPAGSLRFDGRPTRERPTDHPTLYQWLEDTGGANTTAYLWPGDPLPPYPDAPGRRRTPVFAVAGGMVFASAALLAGAGASRAAYEGAGTTLDNVDARRSLTNGLCIGAGVMFAGGVGVGVSGLAVGR